MLRRRLPAVVVPLILWIAGAVPAVSQVTVTAANPSAAAPGSINLMVTVSGSGFKKGAKAQFFLSGTTNPGDITVTGTAFSSTNQVVATITVSSTATNASYDIQVTNTNGSSGKGTELFGVNSSATGSCTSQNPPVNIVFAPGSGGLHLIYGDSDFGSGPNTYNDPNDPEFNGGTLYTGGVFNVCSSSLDLTLNLNTSSRFINASFFQQITPPDPSAINVSNHTYPITFFNLRNAYALQTVGDTLNTCWFNSVQYNNNQNFSLRFESASTDPTTCPNPAMYNTGGDTSVVQITHPDACTWLVHPLPDSSGYDRGGLVETLKKQTVTGGQYNLPFAMKVTLSTCP